VHFLRLLILPVQRVRLVVADGGINGDVWEFFPKEIVEFFHDVRILFVAGVPNCMRGQVSSHDDVRQILLVQKIVKGQIINHNLIVHQRN